MPNLRRPSPALVVATAAFAVALGGVTYAAIPGANNTIHSCYDARGALRVIDEKAACDQTETALDFSQTGPQGAPGAQGIPGPHGEPGQTKLLNFTHPGGVNIARKAGTPVGSFDLPEGKWQVTFTGGVKIPSSRPASTPTGQKVRASALNAYRPAGFGGPVTCNMAMGDGSVHTTVGYSSLIGLLVPAVQKQHGSGGGGGAGRGQEAAAIYMQLVTDAPAGGGHGVLSCTQGKAAPGFATPAAQLHDISIHAVQVNDVGELNFTPGR